MVFPLTNHHHHETLAQGEITYARRANAFRAAFGADYTGPNNWTNGPGYLTFFTTLRNDIGRLATLNISVANLFNRGTGAPYGFSIYNGGFSQAQLGPNPSGTGLAVSGIPKFLQSAPPLTIRFSLSKRFTGI